MRPRSTGWAEAKPRVARGRRCRSRLGVSPRSRGRWHAWQPEVVTQRRPLVLTPKQPARLKLRHDQVDEVGQRPGEVRGKDVETVRGFLDKPFLQRVGDALGGPAEDPGAAGGRGQ